MGRHEAEVTFAAELRLFLAPRHRAGRAVVACDGTSSLGHVVESLGVPLPEVGTLTVNGQQATPGYRLAAGDAAEAGAVRRPQPVPAPRFVLDVHLGTLARRLRLVGVDTAYTPSDPGDEALVEQANASGRVLLTQDRGLLHRRALWLGAYVRGALPDDQLRDVLDRFAPPLAPWTRCTACNGRLAPAAKADVEQQLEPGTQHTYQAFSRCQGQAAAVWDGGKLAFGPVLLGEKEPFPVAGSPVSQSLALLGVTRSEYYDEFGAAGLDQKRHTEDWLPKAG